MQCRTGVCENSCVYRSLYVIASNEYSYVSEIRMQIHVEQCNAGQVCVKLCVYRSLCVIWGDYDY